MAREPIFEWTAKEYEPDEKPAEWYWGLGILTTAGVVASALFGDYLLSIVFVTGAIAIGLQAAKEPTEHHFMLDEQGLTIGHRLYPFDMMHSYSMFEYIDDSKAPVLSIRTHSLIAPHLMIPLEGVDADHVYAFLFAYIEEGAHEETFVDRLIEKLGL